MKSNRWARSLRFRLTLWYTGVLATILLLAAGLLYAGAQRALQTETDAFLASEAHRIAVAAAGAPADPPEAGDLAEAVGASPADTARAAKSAGLLPFDSAYARLLSRAGANTLAVSSDLKTQPALLASLDSLLREPVSPDGRFAFAGPNEERRMRVLTTPVRVGPTQGLLQVAVPWDHNADVLERLAFLLAAALPLVLLLAAGGGWILVGRTLQPIGRIVAEAERLDASALPEALLPEADESDSEIGHLVATLNQMTTRLRRAFESQRRFAEAQQRFAADASHELRTPLTILRGEMELALSRPREASVYQATLRSAVEEIDRMSRIVEGLGFLARQDADPGQPARSTEQVDLTRLGGSVMAELAAKAASRGIALAMDTGNGPVSPIVVPGDAGQIHLLLRNLVDNAVKYTGPGGRVTLAVARQQDHAIVAVSDTGIGIAPEDLPHVFHRFWRADRARASEGSGLGLAISKQIAEAHGGTLTAESRLGHGATFCFTLPAG